MSLVAANGITATRARVQIPARVRWWLDLELDGDATLLGSVTTQFGDLTLVGTVVSGGSYQGRSCYRVVAGAGGWSHDLPAKAYSNDAGVKLSTILGDAARECGETLEGAGGSTIGSNFVRAADHASWCLNQLSPQWYVDESGITRIGQRATTTYTGDAVRQATDLAAGRIELATNAISSLLPGAMVDGLSIVDVEHTYNEGKIRTVVWGSRGETDGRRLAAWRELIAQCLPDLQYRGTYEFRVVTQSGERLNLQPTRVSTGMPELRRVRVRPGVPGCRADVALGSCVLVTFVNADPGRPVVIAGDDPEAPGFAPTRLDLVGEDDPLVSAPESLGRVVRYGDPITFAAPGPGVVALPAVGSLSRVRA